MDFVKAITPEQWKWLLERRMEGYMLRELAEFLGVHPRTIYRHWEELKLTTPTLERVPLRKRRNEFYQLGGKEESGK
jgi:hypothetical protein